MKVGRARVTFHREAVEEEYRSEFTSGWTCFSMDQKLFRGKITSLQRSRWEFPSSSSVVPSDGLLFWRQVQRFVIPRVRCLLVTRHVGTTNILPIPLRFMFRLRTYGRCEALHFFHAGQTLVMLVSLSSFPWGNKVTKVGEIQPPSNAPHPPMVERGSSENACIIFQAFIGGYMPLE